MKKNLGDLKINLIQNLIVKQRSISLSRLRNLDQQLLQLKILFLSLQINFRENSHLGI